MTHGSSLRLAANISDARLASIARDLARDLTRAGIEAKTVEDATTHGERGDAVTLGQLALGLVTSGAVTALIECLKAYIVRERTLIARVKRPDGVEIEISAKNVNDPALERALGILPLQPL
jgi:Effector Associated Constant Component 1